MCGAESIYVGVFGRLAGGLLLSLLHGRLGEVVAFAYAGWDTHCNTRTMRYTIL
jgi:hypothetical protein